MSGNTLDPLWPFGPAESIVGDWIDAKSGLRLVVLVGPLGSLNGYVAVREDHPLYGRSYGDCLQGCGDDFCYGHSVEGLMTVHGGVTYSGDTIGSVKDGEWWFGFDCAHAGDFVPGIDARYSRGDGVLRAPEWVAAEVTKLAHQIAAWGEHPGRSQGGE